MNEGLCYQKILEEGIIEGLKPVLSSDSSFCLEFSSAGRNHRQHWR
jgi:hypothetical protein